MSHYKSDDKRKDAKLYFRTTKDRAKFIERLAHQMFRTQKVTKDGNKNAAIERCIDYAVAGQKEFGWDEVLNG